MAPPTRLVAPVLVALLVLLAGCSVLGGGGTPAATTTATPAGGTATATASPTATSTETTTEATGPGSATPTDTLQPTETSFSDAGIRVVEVNEDPAGADAENLNDEYIVLENTGDLPIDLSGWRVKDLDGHVHTFQDGVELGIGETLTLRSGAGSQTATDRFWWADEPVWDNNGETIYVFDDRGQKVYQRTYR